MAYTLSVKPNVIKYDMPCTLFTFELVGPAMNIDHMLNFVNVEEWCKENLEENDYLLFNGVRTRMMYVFNEEAAVAIRLMWEP